MTFEADLISLLLPAFDDRVFYDTTPDNFTDRRAPFVIINFVGGRAKWYVDQSMRDVTQADVQFTVWGARREEVSAAALQIETILAESVTDDVFAIEPLAAPIHDYDEALKLRGSFQRFGIWYKNPLA